MEVPQTSPVGTTTTTTTAATLVATLMVTAPTDQGTTTPQVVPEVRADETTEVVHVALTRSLGQTIKLDMTRWWKRLI